MKGRSALADEQCFAHRLKSTFSLWVWLGARKRPTRLSSPHWGPCQGSVQVCKSFSKPVALQIRHTQKPVVRTLDADLSTDQRPSASPEQSGEGLLKRLPMCLRQRKSSQLVKDQGEDVRGKRLCPALSFKDNLLESLVPTRAFTLACTSDQFRSSWRSGLNYTPKMRTGPSLQQRGPGMVSLPLEAPSRKPTLLSKLTLAPAIRSYSPTAFFTAFISRRRDTNTVISSPNAETLAVRGPAKGTLRRAGFVPSSLSLRSRGLKARTEKRRQGAALPDRTLDRERPRTPSVHLHHCLRVVVHHSNSSAELRLESGSLQNSRQKPMVNPIKGLCLI